MSLVRRDITLKQKLTRGYYPLPGQKQKTTGEGRGGGITHFDLEKAKYKQELHYPLDKWDMGNVSKLIQNCIAFISWMYYIACRPGLKFLGALLKCHDIGRIGNQWEASLSDVTSPLFNKGMEHVFMENIGQRSNLTK